MEATTPNPARHAQTAGGAIKLKHDPAPVKIPAVPAPPYPKQAAQVKGPAEICLERRQMMSKIEIALSIAKKV